MTINISKIFGLIISNTSISPKYFKNKMTWNELASIMDSLDEKLKTEYEMVRMLMHTIYQTNSSKKIELTDVIKYPWDFKEEVNTDRIISYEEAIKLLN